MFPEDAGHRPDAGTAPEEDELLKIGVPGAAHVLVQPY